MSRHEEGNVIEKWYHFVEDIELIQVEAARAGRLDTRAEADVERHQGLAADASKRQGHTVHTDSSYRQFLPLGGTRQRLRRRLRMSYLKNTSCWDR